MHDVAQIIEAPPPVVQAAVQPRQHRGGGVGGAGENLRGGQRAGLVVVQGEVGERAANVDAREQRHLFLLRNRTTLGSIRLPGEPAIG